MHYEILETERRALLPFLTPLKTEFYLNEPFLRLASLADIGGMKLSAITSRAAYKDYVDLYYILKQLPLASGFAVAFPEIKSSIEKMVKEYTERNLGI